MRNKSPILSEQEVARFDVQTSASPMKDHGPQDQIPQARSS